MKKAISEIKLRYSIATVGVVLYAVVFNSFFTENSVTLSLTSVLLVAYLHIFEERKADRYGIIFFLEKLLLTVVVELVLYTIWKQGLIKEPLFYIFLYLSIIFFRFFLKQMIADYIIKKDCFNSEGSERVEKIKEVLTENGIKRFSIYILSELNGIMAAETGIFQKKIIFTKKSLKETEEEQFYFLIFHELAHIKRGDFFKKELIFYTNKIAVFLIVYSFSRTIFFINGRENITASVVVAMLTLQFFHLMEKIIYKKIEEKSLKYGEMLFNIQYKSRNERKNGI